MVKKKKFFVELYGDIEDSPLIREFSSVRAALKRAHALVSANKYNLAMIRTLQNKKLLVEMIYAPFLKRRVQFLVYDESVEKAILPLI
jgi:hypothetical protein